MEKIIDYITNIDLDQITLLKAGGLLLLGTLLLSLFGRFIFGKKSALNNAVSSAIGILFIYALTVIFKGVGFRYASLIPPLPLVEISGNNLTLFSFSGADYTVICSQVLRIIILSFLVNIVDGWLPKGKNIFSWIFFRGLTVLIALVLHFVASGLLAVYLPEGIATYAPPILLGLLILLLLTGALKILVGALMATVNPLIAALYTFFFANFVGKQITKAVLTAAILCGLVLLLQYLGIDSLSIAPAIVTSYAPFAALLILLWFVVGRLL